ncbi:hypothetical protein BBJ28_00009642 [Nothophytophthora sp. Chile5]|nr:hypothetical protein BBJ28_00009642 [Nothophytophthora sp. Chile5]
MDRNVPPPRAFGGPPLANGRAESQLAQPRSFVRREPAQSAVATPPIANETGQEPHSFGFGGAAPPPPPPQPTNIPPFGRKRPSAASMDSNVSWSGSEVESVGSTAAPQVEEQRTVASPHWSSSSPVLAQEQPGQQDLAPAASLFDSPSDAQATAPTVPDAEAEEFVEEDEDSVVVQPPKTPQGSSTYATFDDQGGLSASQRVRMELSAHAGGRGGSRSNSSENVFVSDPPSYDEEKNGPRSCPSAFNNAKQPQFSIDKLRQLRSNELIASKLLPTRTSVNSLMGYVRELQMSEASLRKQLVKTKQHTEVELSQSLSKVSELERTMQEVERDRELARQKLEEQEQLIRDLAAKLQQAEAQTAASVDGTGSSGMPGDELPPIAEESVPMMEATTGEHLAVEPPGDVIETSEVSAVSRDLPPIAPIEPEQSQGYNRAAEFALASPRSPNRPLWDPWASGSVTPMKSLPPMFTIGSTEMDVVATSRSSPQGARANSTATAVREYELRSVLPSPRRTQAQAQEADGTESSQQREQYEAASMQQGPGMFAPQYPAPMFNVGAVPPSPPSPPSQQQQESVPYGTPQADYVAPNQEEMPMMESPSQAPPMFAVGATPPTDEGSYQQEMTTSVPLEGDAAGNVAMEWSGLQTSQDVQGPPPGVFSPPIAADPQDSENVMTAFPPQSEQSTQSPPLMAQETATTQEYAQQVETNAATVENMQEGGARVPGADQESAAAALSAPPAGPPLPPQPAAGGPTLLAPPPRGPVPSAKKQDKSTPSEPAVSFETMLVDFFTEVDKKRLKMAKVYGKRYAGREKWLFAELTKRYGATKVAALKTRFEGGSNAGSSTSTEHHPTGLHDASEHAKAPRQGHPRHPQFFHPPTPASGLDSGAEMPPVPTRSTPPQENEDVPPQNREPVEVGITPPVQEEKASPARAARVSPRQRRSGGNSPAFSGPSPPFAPSQVEDPTGPPVMNGQPPMNGPPPMNDPSSVLQQEDTNGQATLPQPPPRGEENDSAAPLGLRQRYNNSGSSTQAQTPAAAAAAAPAPVVTLEELLKELYQKHQPDKLKNVPIVAKQYAGKERELVGLLKGKYGALSVKRLEENLEALERAHLGRKSAEGAGKQRGCFMRSISLMFWLAVLSGFAFGAVFVSFVVLNAQECRSIEGEDSTLDSADKCLPLKKELENFTYERVGDYARQSHPKMCFCAEWSERESALLTNLSADDLADLAKLVPFSPDSFGAPWILTVKELVPSQQFYESYAKPVVDLSLDAGAFVWSSLMELMGSEKVGDEKPVAASIEVASDALNVTTALEEPKESFAVDVQIEEPEQFVEESDAAVEDDAAIDDEAVIIADKDDASSSMDEQAADSTLELQGTGDDAEVAAHESEVDTVSVPDEGASADEESEEIESDIPMESAAVEGDEESEEVGPDASTEPAAVEGAEDVVEMEVRQDGLDLSYPEIEVEPTENADTTDVSTAASLEEVHDASSEMVEDVEEHQVEDATIQDAVIPEAVEEQAPVAEDASSDEEGTTVEIEEAAETVEFDVLENGGEDETATAEVVPSSMVEEESGGIVSTVNEVLARLVGPFEARKTAVPVSSTESDDVQKEQTTEEDVAEEVAVENDASPVLEETDDDLGTGELVDQDTTSEDGVEVDFVEVMVAAVDDENEVVVEVASESVDGAVTEGSDLAASAAADEETHENPSSAIDEVEQLDIELPIESDDLPAVEEIDLAINSAESVDAEAASIEDELTQEAPPVTESDVERVLGETVETEGVETPAEHSTEPAVEEAAAEEIEGSRGLLTDESVEAIQDSEEGTPASYGEFMRDAGIDASVDEDLEDIVATTTTTHKELEAEFPAASNEEVVSEVREEVVLADPVVEEEPSPAADIASADVANVDENAAAAVEEELAAVETEAVEDATEADAALEVEVDARETEAEATTEAAMAVEADAPVDLEVEVEVATATGTEAEGLAESEEVEGEPAMQTEVIVESDAVEPEVEVEATMEGEAVVETDEAAAVDIATAAETEPPTEAEVEVVAAEDSVVADVELEEEVEQAAEVEADEEESIAAVADADREAAPEAETKPEIETLADAEAEEDVLFMDDLEDPEEVLRMAEQAAAAEL